MNAEQGSGQRVPPPLFFLAAFGLGVALELAWPIDDPAVGWRIAAAAAGLAASFALDIGAMRRFRAAGTDFDVRRPSTALVTDGPYRLTRNPMYVGMALLYAGLAVAAGVIWALATLPLALVAVDRLAIAREEPYLEARFGDAYRTYKSRVRRWL